MEKVEAQPEEAPPGGEPVVEASAAGPTASDANVDAELLWSTVHTAVSSPFPRCVLTAQFQTKVDVLWVSNVSLFTTFLRTIVRALCVFFLPPVCQRELH
jgi:hypothetical protein